MSETQEFYITETDRYFDNMRTRFALSPNDYLLNQRKILRFRDGYFESILFSMIMDECKSRFNCGAMSEQQYILGV